MTEDDADDTERAEAAALATSLEGSTRDGEPPEDALKTAALLRYSGREGELSPERADALLEELQARPLPAAPSARPWWLRWLPVGVGSGLAALAALSLLMLTSQDVEPVERASVQTELPAPGPELLAAQAELARSESRGQAFDREMGAYRERVLRRLETLYPVALGALDADRRRR